MTEKVGVAARDYVRPDELSQLTYLEQGFFCDVVSPLVEQQPADDRFLTFDEIAATIGRRIAVVGNINDAAGMTALEAARPDLIVSIRFGSILRDAAIAVPRLGVLNLHSGLLPRYKGILTTLHALAAGESTVGCTLHRIDSASIDAGPIVATASVSVDDQRSLLWHVLQLYPLGCEMITDAVSTLAGDRPLPSELQNNDGQPYFPLPTVEDFLRLRERGFTVWHGEDLSSIFAHYR